jgi:hypothetical protein
VDRHRFLADSDPTFHFGADPQPDPNPTLSFTQVEKLYKITFIQSSASLPILLIVIYF